MYSLAMERHEEQALINAIALRVGTAGQLSERFGIPVPELRAFAAERLERIQAAKRRLEGEEEPPKADSGKALSPENLSDLWITNKFERLKRLQEIAEASFEELTGSAGMTPAEYATSMREFRSYLMLAANELGQLLNRGAGDSGDGSYLSVEISGVNMENLR